MTPPAGTSRMRIAFAMAGGLLFAGSLLYFAWQYLTGFSAPATPGTSGRAVSVNFALFTVFGLHHSLFARFGLKAAIARAVGPPLERSVYVWIASVLFLAVCAYWQPVPGRLWHVSAPWSWLLYAVQAGAGVFTIAAARHLDILELSGVAQAVSRAPSRQGLDDHGPYGLVRHPIYFAWLLLVWPAPDMNGTRLVFAIISTVYLLVAIPFEEKDLRRTFGEAYSRYSKKVRWRVLPGVY
jgi:protein-S-isoprenylcysteine O-methyltransferase Ste14